MELDLVDGRYRALLLPLTLGREEGAPLALWEAAYLGPSEALLWGKFEAAGDAPPASSRNPNPSSGRTSIHFLPWFHFRVGLGDDLMVSAVSSSPIDSVMI